MLPPDLPAIASSPPSVPQKPEGGVHRMVTHPRLKAGQFINHFPPTNPGGGYGLYPFLVDSAGHRMGSIWIGYII